ncbi:MAG: hypothetical protein J3R72DRAFT_441957 [Linnemannia gamsii]|nr:MAG: hypothetical protein J3R72DRAFT_441957 [Linnemannia gamsii]
MHLIVALVQLSPCLPYLPALPCHTPLISRSSSSSLPLIMRIIFFVCFHLPLRVSVCALFLGRILLSYISLCCKKTHHRSIDGTPLSLV